MNFKMIGKITGSAMVIEAACLILMMFVSLIYREDVSPFLYTIAILVVLGGLLSFATRKSNAFSSRGGFASTVLIWLAFTAFGALPFWFCGQFESYTDCFFEAMSGFTTTGASLLTAIMQSSAYLTKLSPRLSSSLSSSFSMMFESSGDRFPPCGVPMSVFS